jgi:glutathionylspermidine synthase
MAWAAKEAGLTSHYTTIEDIGLTTNGQFVDGDSRVIGAMFKLYPWEDLLRDSYATSIAGSNCRFIEPAWKALVSNKGILPVLWNMFPGHENLLPAYWANESHSLTDYVTKPIFSREGASVRIFENGKLTEASANQEYDQNSMIVQEYCPLPVFDGYRPIIGSWIVGQTCVGIGIREDQSRITQDLSRFKPHYIKN